MSWKYLGIKKWADITRDERFFCAHLYFEFLQNINPFLNLLFESKLIDKEEINSSIWEAAYEVCFYRDFIHQIGINGINEIGKTEFSLLGKRTFDLCLFSENKIIIIEAKAQQGFETEQMESFKTDLLLVKKLIGENVAIKLLGLTSSKYNPKVVTKARFDALINWEQIQKLYKNNIFSRANEIYKNYNLNEPSCT